MSGRKANAAGRRSGQRNGNSNIRPNASYRCLIIFWLQEPPLLKKKVGDFRAPAERFFRLWYLGYPVSSIPAYSMAAAGWIQAQTVLQSQLGNVARLNTRLASSWFHPFQNTDQEPKRNWLTVSTQLPPAEISTNLLSHSRYQQCQTDSISEVDSFVQVDWACFCQITDQSK